MTDYDVTGFTDNELIDVYHHIDKDSYLDRFESIVAEMKKRHLFIEDPDDHSLIPKNRFDLKPGPPEDIRNFLKPRMQMGVMWGLTMTLFSLFCFYQRLSISVEGIVVERLVKCNEKGNRCWTHYTIMNDNGDTTIYKAPPNDTALRRDIQVGSRIQKKYMRLNYTVDSVPQKDLPIMTYSLLLLIGLSLVIQGIEAFKSYRKLDESEFRSGWS